MQLFIKRQNITIFSDLTACDKKTFVKTYKSNNWLKVDKATGMFPVNWLPERELKQDRKAQILIWNMLTDKGSNSKKYWQNFL